MNDIQRHYVVLRFVLAVKRMKVRRGMIVPIHPNKDSKELTDCRHASILGSALSGKPE